MESLVVYESVYGNTAQVAEAIAGVLGEDHSVRLAAVEENPALPDDLGVLIVGAPTYMHGVPRGFAIRKTRKEPRAVSAPEGGPDVRAWLAALPMGESRPAVAFDTRAAGRRWLLGAAAPGLAKRFRKRGYTELCKPEGFIVTGTEGPLAEGEVERARAWARDVLTALQRTPSVAGLSGSQTG
jgi:hypothetical protein